MKNDYDFSKHVRVPEEWMEKALAVPSAQPAPRVKFLNNRRLAAAAVIVLALGFGAGSYFLFRNINSVSVAPSPSQSTLYPTVPQSSTAGSDVPLSPTQPLTEPAQSSSAPSQSSTAPTQAEPTSRPTSAPTAPPAPTQPYTKPSPTAPASTGEPSGRPSEAPTSAQSTSPHIDPDEDPSENPDYENDPDQVKYIEICHTPGPDFPVSPADASGDPAVIYCRLYDGSGRLVGEPDLYCAAHLAEWVFTDEGSYMFYRAAVPDPNSAGIAYTDPVRTYTYEFYNKRGTVLGTGTFKV